MKKNISFSKEIIGDYIVRQYMKDGKTLCYEPNHPVMTIKYPKDMEMYEHPFLSWENLSYAFEEPDQEELDDYLLYHALQDGKKTGLSVWTKKIEEIEKVLGNDYTILKDQERNGNEHIFVIRKGSLSDYFNEDKLMEYYDSLSIDYNDAVFDILFNSEIKEIFLQKVSLYGDVPYYPIIDMAGGDGIARSYGASGALIAGLLFGYPIESTWAMIRCNSVFRRL